MRKMSSGQWLGVAAIVVGLLWVGFLSLELMKDLLAGGTGLGRYVVPIGFFLIITLPAVLSVYWGARVLETPTTYRIRRASGFLMTMLAFFALGIPSPFFGSDDRLGSLAWMLAVTIAAIGVHAVTCRMVSRREGFQTLGCREFIGKLAIFLVALQIWMIGSPLVERYAPKDPDFPRLAERPWEFIGTFGSILLAWAFYRVSVRFVQRGRWEPTKVAGASP